MWLNIGNFVNFWSREFCAILVIDIWRQWIIIFINQFSKFLLFQSIIYLDQCSFNLFSFSTNSLFWPFEFLNEFSILTNSLFMTNYQPIFLYDQCSLLTNSLYWSILFCDNFSFWPILHFLTNSLSKSILYSRDLVFIFVLRL